MLDSIEENKTLQTRLTAAETSAEQLQTERMILQSQASRYRDGWLQTARINRKLQSSLNDAETDLAMARRRAVRLQADLTELQGRIQSDEGPAPLESAPQAQPTPAKKSKTEEPTKTGTVLEGEAAESTLEELAYVYPYASLVCSVIHQQIVFLHSKLKLLAGNRLKEISRMTEEKLLFVKEVTTLQAQLMTPRFIVIFLSFFLSLSLSLSSSSSSSSSSHTHTQ